jgi:hypothetical protein
MSILTLCTTRRRPAARLNNRRRSRPLLESLEGRQLLTLSPDQVYTALQQFQLQQQALATVHGTVDVGTFNARNGFFTGLGGSIWEYDDPGGPGTGPIMKPRPPVVGQGPPGSTYLNSVNVGLTFEVINGGTGVFSVTVNGTTVSGAPGQKQVAIEVGQASHFDYTVSCGRRSYSGSFDIVRPPHIGVTTIPVIPIGVIYDAPQDAAHHNTTSLTQTNSRSTTVSVEYSRESSTTTPGTIPGGYGDLMSVENVLNGAAKALSNIPAVKQIADTVNNLFSNLFGSVQYSSTNTDLNAQSSTYGVTYTDSTTTTPTTHLGPGEGDLIEFIPSARLVTVGWNGQATTAKLYDDAVGTPQTISVHLLKERLAALGTSNGPDPVTGFDRTTIQGLLSLDPLATGGPDAPLDPGRYIHVTDFALNGAQVQKTFTINVSSTQTYSQTHTVINTRNDKSGWLSFLGIGVTDDNSSKVTMTNKNSNTSGTSQTVTATINLYAGAEEYYKVQIYYDALFGSVLLREVPVVGGSAVKISSNPPAGASQAAVQSAIAPGSTSVATSTASQQSHAPGAATSAPAQLSVRPKWVVSDPPRPSSIPRGELVPQDVP